MRRRLYRGRHFARAQDIAELRAVALRRLPGFVAEYLEGGAESEQTLRRNEAAFEEIRFVHRSLVDVSACEPSVEIFGQRASLPIAIGPTGFNGLLWRNADVALAKAARRFDVPFTVSTVSSDSLEAIADAAGGRLWFQLYVVRDPIAVERLVERADQAACEALLVTVDAATIGNRTWDVRNYARPLKLKLAAKLDTLLHLRWLLGVFLPRGLPAFGNLDEFLPAGQRSPLDGARFMASQMNTQLVWDDVRRLRDRWPRRLILKGVLATADIVEAARLGVDAVVLSNHGGRQLDGDVAGLDMLPEAIEAAAGRLAIFVDGGVRRGADIAKAIALGAKAVLVGRSTLYGVAAGGEAGASHALDILKRELERVLVLLGCPRARDLGPGVLRRAPVRSLA